MAELSSHREAGPSPEKVSGAASRAVIRLLGDRGIPANEVVITRAVRRGTGEDACWVLTALRGREQAHHEVPLDLVDRVLARGPCDEWYGHVRQLLEDVGMAFPD